MHPLWEFSEELCPNDNVPSTNESTIFFRGKQNILIHHFKKIKHTLPYGHGELY